MKTIQLEANELNVIENSKAETIKKTFEPMAIMLSEFEDNFNEIIAESKNEITSELTSKAKRLRLDIAKVRISTEKIRKEQKDEYLRAGKAIDGVSNILKWAISDKEHALKSIEDHFDNLEKERLENLQLERVGLLKKYVDDAQERELSSMESDVWDAYLSSKKKQYEDRIEAENKAEEDRIAKEKAEAAERLRISKENEKLKKEAKEKELARLAEEKKRQEIETARLKKEAEEKKKRDLALEAERLEREEVLKAEREARLKAEQEAEKKRLALETELKAKIEAEKEAKEKAEIAIQNELNKGDEDKVVDLINELKNIKKKYSFKSAKNKKMFNDTQTLIDKVVAHIESINLNK